MTAGGGALVYTRLARAAYVEWWHERYGGPDDTFDRYAFWQRGRNTVWASARDTEPGDVEPVDGIGIPLLRIGRRIWKPTTIAALHFGAIATRNVFEVTAAETRVLLDRGALEPAPDDPRLWEGMRGFVIPRYLGAPIGLAEWRRGTLASVISKSRRISDLDLPEVAL